jgi:hypothetical protein
MTYTVSFTSTGTVTADKGTVDNGTKTVSGIAAGQKVVLTADLNGCKITAEATKDCNCPTIDPPAGSDKEYCAGDTKPTLTVTVASGLTADWYNTASGGTKITSGLSYTPTAAGAYFVEAINTSTNCKSATRLEIKLIENPKPTVSVQTVCSSDGKTFDITVATNGTKIESDKGVVSGIKITGVTSGETATITVTSAKGCKATTTATQNCTVPVGSIGDFVFEDTDNSGTQTAGDLPVILN